MTLLTIVKNFISAYVSQTNAATLQFSNCFLLIFFSHKAVHHMENCLGKFATFYQVPKGKNVLINNSHLKTPALGKFVALYYINPRLLERRRC